ncbi:MAG: RNA pyrophosphohydrolase [Aestuariivita sp.]|nr:RNA pyrophosphohydrolase [Aestuariivita sp.]
MTVMTLSELPYRLCVGIMLINASRNVFVGQRKDRFQKAWQMPQGGIESGEHPYDAALRELHEETGIRSKLIKKMAETSNWIRYDLPLDLVGNIWAGKYKGQEQKWFLFKFLGADSDININSVSPEFSSWRWQSPNQLVEEIVPFKRDVYQQVLKEFKLYF